MKCFFKATILAIMLVVSLHITAKAQREFIDSIRNMLTDLDAQIQYEPINQLLRHSIPFCTGDTMNDSLTAALKELISEEYIFKNNFLQPVSRHLIIKYFSFLERIAQYFVKTGPPELFSQNIMRLAITEINLSGRIQSDTCLKKARTMLSQLQFTGPFLFAKKLYALARTYAAAYRPDSLYILCILSLKQNPNITGEEKILYAESLFAAADFCRARQKNDTAFLMFEQVLDLRKKIHGEHDINYIAWLLRTADMYNYMSKYKLAQELNFKALELMPYNTKEENSLYALCLNNIGEVYYRTGEYDKALPYTQQALELKQKIFGEDYFDNVINLHNLATLYTRIGLYNEAIPLLNESLAISKKYFGEGLVYSLDLHALAEVYEYMGEYDKALPQYQKALGIQRKNTEKDFYYPRTLHSIASLFTKLGQYDKAIDYFIMALEIKKEVFGKLNPEYTKTLNSYAEACMLSNNYKKALSLQLQSLELNKKIFGNIHPNTATGYYNLSTVYFQQGDIKKAENACALSLQMRKKILGETHPDVAACYDMLGNINRKKHLFSAALTYYTTSFEIRKKTLAVTHPDYISSLCNIGTLPVKSNRTQETVQFLMAADSAALLHIEQSYGTLSEEEKLIYLQNIEKQFQYLPSLLYLQKTKHPEIVNRVYNDAIALKSMVLFHQQYTYNSIRKSGDSSALALYHLWRFNKALTGQQILLPPAKRLSSFDSLQNITNQTEEQLSRISISFRQNTVNNRNNSKEIIQELATGEAAIEFIRFRLFNNEWSDSIIYAALILLPGKSNPLFVPLFEEKQLQNILRFSNNTGEASINYLYPAADKATATSNKLYRLVWQPIQALLNNIHTIYYSPCGLLNKLSFAALHTGNEKMLNDQYNLEQLLCTRSLAWQEEGNMHFSNASLWGNINYNTASHEKHLPINDSSNNSMLTPVYDISTSNKNYLAGLQQPLPGTKKETENIVLLLKEKNISCMQYSENTANEEQFKKMDGTSADLLHIATHGFFLPPLTSVANRYTYSSNSFFLQQDPMFRSGILLAGSGMAWSGDTTFADAEDGVLTAYEIAQLDLSNTKLVTLSACETALGDIKDNEGVFGLQRAFKMAGVKQVLMSLWKVPDEETTKLMTLFYSFLLQDNTAGNALRKAQLIMKKNYAPYYWAGFVLTQ